MSGIVLGFSGRVGSGKTSISEEVAHHYNWPRVSFGDYVRKMAKERGLDSSSRNVLQSLGETLIKSGIEEFCQSVIKQAAWKPGQSLVIDGIRHQDVLNKLKEIVSPSSFVLVYISINEENRWRRIAQRDGLSSNELNNVDEHSTEKETKLVLEQLADIIIDGEQPIEMAVKQISNRLSRLPKKEE